MHLLYIWRQWRSCRGQTLGDSKTINVNKTIACFTWCTKTIIINSNYFEIFLKQSIRPVAVDFRSGGGGQMWSWTGSGKCDLSAIYLLHHCFQLIIIKTYMSISPQRYLYIWEQNYDLQICSFNQGYLSHINPDNRILKKLIIVFNVVFKSCIKNGFQIHF